jgi:hypothetical protein
MNQGKGLFFHPSSSILTLFVERPSQLDYTTTYELVGRDQNICHYLGQTVLPAPPDSNHNLIY